MRMPTRIKPGTVKYFAEWNPDIGSRRKRWSQVRTVEEGNKMSASLDVSGVSRVRVETYGSCGWFVTERWVNGEKVFEKKDGYVARQGVD